MNIVTDKPVWFVIFCIALGIWFALILYYRDKKNDFSQNILYLLSFLRFASITIIAFMLLSPLLKTLIRSTEKPIIIFAQDQSESVTVNKDSSFYKKEYPEKVKELFSSLDNKFQVRQYSFGEKVSEEADYTFTQKTTDISSLIEDIRTRYANRNVGALVISSDGLYNKGINPVYSAEKFPFPIYTVALGDTTLQKDLLISKINYNRTAFLGNKFPLEILVKAGKSLGSAAILEVKKNNNVLFSKNIRINSERFTETVNFTLDAKETGVQHYTIGISRLEQEISYDNNTQDIFITVLEGKEKVLLLSSGAHPDVAALKDGIESNSNYQVTVALVNEYSDPVKPFNLIILNQLPSPGTNIQPIINQANEAGIPLLYIIGNNTSLQSFNSLKTGLVIQQDKTGFTESQAALNNDFVLFSLSDETRKFIADLPPLSCPFGSYKLQTSTSSFVDQKIGSLITDRPLILFGQEPSRKYGVITGEGIWRWRLSNYAQKNNHEAFNELITKMVQFLSVRMNREPFQVKCNHQFFENEPITITAELYNPSFELITEPEIDIVITDEENKTYPFTFSRNSNAYQLTAGLFPAGVYKYAAKTKVGNKIYTAAGEFTVIPVRLETVNTTADHNVLYNLASLHDGKMINVKNLQELAVLLNKREDLKTISYTQKRFTEWINIPLVFLLILILLSIEWFIRKRSGSY
ncbi:MAG: hypothetical protein AB9842_08365 [Bacteroidales bacterium]